MDIRYIPRNRTLENWRECKEELQNCTSALIKRSSRYLLRYGPPRISCKGRLKCSGQNTLESRNYNPRVRNYRWERSATVGEVLCISTKEGNSRTQVYIIGLFQKPKETLEQKFFGVRC